MGQNSERVIDAGIERQRTLKNRIGCTGIGLHSGSRITMTLQPAPANSGVVFRRTDVPDAVAVVPARYDRVSATMLCTTVANEHGTSVATIEHLMAAFAGCGIDNVLVELDGPEVPAMDGSAAPFVFLIECADVVEQRALRRYLEVLKPVEVRQGDGLAMLTPGGSFTVRFEIDFPSLLVGEQHCFFAMAEGAFKTELARARTFGFAHEVDGLRARGLALGGSLQNAVIVGEERVLNDEGLRYRDEFVRHKALDSIGDLYLAGVPLLGHFHGERSGHALNNRLLRRLFADRTAWRLVRSPKPAAARRRHWATEQAAASA